MKTIAILVLLCSSVALSAKDAKDKDKPTPKPGLTDAQKVELLTIERKVMQAHIQALPYMQAEQAASAELQAKEKQLEELFHSADWRLDLLTLEFVAAPKEAPTAKEPAPAK